MSNGARRIAGAPGVSLRCYCLTAKPAHNPLFLLLQLELQQAAGGMSPFQGVMSILGVVGGMAQFADAALEAVHVFLNLSARLCERLGWARQELSGAVAAASAAAAAARTARSSSSSSRMSANMRRLLTCAAVGALLTCDMCRVACDV